MVRLGPVDPPPLGGFASGTPCPAAPGKIAGRSDPSKNYSKIDFLVVQEYPGSQVSRMEFGKKPPRFTGGDGNFRWRATETEIAIHHLRDKIVRASRRPH